MGRCDDYSSNFCSRLEFYDGPTANSSSLGRLCTNSELTAKISSGNQMFVKFYSSFSPDRGFLAEYSESHEPPSPTSTHASSPSSKGAESSKYISYIRCFTSNRKQEVNMVRINSKALQTYSYHTLLVLYFRDFYSTFNAATSPKRCKNPQYFNNNNISQTFFMRFIINSSA